MTNPDRRAEQRDEQAAVLSSFLDELLPTEGDERALDVGTGAGAFAYALSSRVREVVAVEIDEELAARARADAPPNVEVLVANGEQLPFESYDFDLSVTLRTLHHTPRPELLVAELIRVTKLGGTILVADQLAPADPLEARDLIAFERARDPSTTRVLSDADMRGLFDSNGLVLRRSKMLTELRDLESYLDLAGCTGEEREEIRRLIPKNYAPTVGWYVLER
jgi:ubiquinone/menaquinone biosynthesis C-methylase UbiE